ncbi:MAG: 6-bladed beta-propeller [Acidobacteriota bacterium]|jgi:hypothetical protein
MLHRSTTCAAALTFALVCAAPAGCAGNAPDGPTHAFTVTAEDGVEIARTTGGPKYDGEIFRYEKVLEIRPDPEVEESCLYSPQWMAMGGDGRIFVGDMGDEQVVVFDETGRYLYRIGRKGQGPGEFQVLAFVDVEDDVLWVTDWFRVHRFTLDGTLIATDELPPEARRLMRDGRWWRLPDGRTLIFNLQSRAEKLAETRAEMYLVDADGAELASAATSWVVTGEELEGADCERPVFLNHFFTTLPWAAYDPDYGFVLVDPTRPEVPIYDDSGALRRILRVDVPERRVTEDDRAWARERLDDVVSRAEAGTRYPTPCIARAQRDNPRFADPKNLWSRPVIDDNGFLWLWIVDDRDSTAEGTPRYAVFSPEGEYLGMTRAPGWAQLYHGHLLARNVDPETEETVPTVYRIRAAVDGLVY